MPSDRSPKLTVKNWVRKIRRGDARAVARACSMIENEEPESERILRGLYPFSGNSMVIGITGPPGAGKSTLLSCLVAEALSNRYKVGVIAVDPSSPVSGGALLADRLRIGGAHSREVYIRSVATRGTLGGLAYASFGILRVLEAMGKDIIFVETVGAGQNEIAVSKLATTTVFVTVPNLGDEIQAMKAGILEVSDIFVVNKSDLGNHETAISQLRFALTLKDPLESPAPPPAGLRGAWKFPILPASALQRKGIAQVFFSIVNHQRSLRSSGELEIRIRRQVRAELFYILEKKLAVEIQSRLTDKILDSLARKRTDPHSLANLMISAKKRRR